MKNDFHNLNIKEKTFVVSGLFIIFITALCTVFAILFFGTVGFFNLTGITYESSSSLVGFIIITSFAGGIADLLKTIINMTARALKCSVKFQAIISFLCEVTSIWLIICLADLLIKGISLDTRAGLLLTLLFLLLNFTFSEQKPQSK